MTKSKRNPKVDDFLREAEKWQEEMTELRAILLDCPLTEELKWGHPCYTFEDKNIAIIQGFKEYCAILFTKGALLKDPKHVLARIGENSQAGRWIKIGRASCRERVFNWV